MTIDRLRVLLVDDNPTFAHAPYREVKHQFEGIPLDNADHRRTIGVWSQKDPRLAAHFEARLLESAETAREFRDLSLRLDACGPGVLGNSGWIPEIVLVDYDLSQQQQQQADLGDFRDLVSPLPKLRQELQRLQRPAPGQQSKPARLPNRGERDRSGCYIGGLIAASFSAHPCVPIPTTVQTDEVVGRDTLFFEWFLEEQFFDAWRNRGAEDPDIGTVVARGVVNLRKRIEEQIKGALVRVSLDDLAAISEATDISDRGLRITSRYITRNLPVAGLFVDETPADAVLAANAWAQGLLSTVLSGSLKSDFERARDLSSKLWNRYNSVVTVERYRLSELLQEVDPAPALAVERDSLVVKFGVVGARCTLECFDLETVKGDDYSELSRRWAALFVMVRLASRAVAAARRWEELCRANHLKLGAAMPELLQTAVTANDVYLALFPTPTEPAAMKRTLDAHFAHRLRRLGKADIPGTNFRELGLRLSDVLEGQGWDPGADRFGLMLGERQLLQMYADDLEFREADWPQWLRR